MGHICFVPCAIFNFIFGRGFFLKILPKLKNSVVAVALGGMLLCGATPAFAEDTGMEAFREAVTMNEQAKDTRIFREQISIFLPDANATIDFQAATHKEDIFRASGKLNFVMVNNEGNTVDYNIPFYLDQNKKKLTVYFSLDNVWHKIAAPVSTATAVDAVTTPDADDLKRVMSVVKNAKTVRESDTERTMNVELDGTALANMIEVSYSKGNDGQENNSVEWDRFLRYLKTGLEQAELNCMWTVDKRNWQTRTCFVDMSDMLQQTARVALDGINPAEIDENARALLADVAFYSEFKAYTTYIDAKTKKDITIPKDVKKAKAFDFMSFFGKTMPQK